MQLPITYPLINKLFLLVTKNMTRLIACIDERFQYLCSWLYLGVHYLLKLLFWLVSTIYDFIIYHVSHFWIEVCYFILTSCLGFITLRGLKTRTYLVDYKPLGNLDLFFTSVSAVTVSSMSTVEMEVFSNTQLVILTILMFIGGEVFTSMVGLHFKASRVGNTPLRAKSRVNSLESLPLPLDGTFEHIELGIITTTATTAATAAATSLQKTKSEIDFLLKSKSIKVLGFMVLGYLLVLHVIGIAMVLAYLTIEPSAKSVLERKGLKTTTFSIFTVVSTFASCGFVPTNENMVVFRRNSGLLLMLIPQMLLGNTLFPPFLRLSIWVLAKFGGGFKKEESKYLMGNNTKEIGYHHLLPRKHSKYLVVTVIGFILMQLIMFCAMDWRLEGLKGLNVYQKLVDMLFQCVNARHTGESVVDLSTVAYANLVIIVVMMYLPPYTSFLPSKDTEEYPEIYTVGKKRRDIILENIIFSRISYLVIFIIIICITERQKMKEDPLNFNVFNIVVEVISAYGNVGFSTGYSCQRQLKPDESCVDKMYGFVGRWSNQGKIVLILVMFYGRLKKFMDGGKAWKLM